jgi:hypothetical protein
MSHWPVPAAVPASITRPRALEPSAMQYDRWPGAQPPWSRSQAPLRRDPLPPVNHHPTTNPPPFYPAAIPNWPAAHRNGTIATPPTQQGGHHHLPADSHPTPCPHPNGQAPTTAVFSSEPQHEPLFQQSQPSDRQKTPPVPPRRSPRASPRDPSPAPPQQPTKPRNRSPSPSPSPARLPPLAPPRLLPVNTNNIAVPAPHPTTDGRTSTAPGPGASTRPTRYGHQASDVTSLVSLPSLPSVSVGVPVAVSLPPLRPTVAATVSQGSGSTIPRRAIAPITTTRTRPPCSGSSGTVSSSNSAVRSGVGSGRGDARSGGGSGSGREGKGDGAAGGANRQQQQRPERAEAEVEVGGNGCWNGNDLEGLEGFRHSHPSRGKRKRDEGG